MSDLKCSLAIPDVESLANLTRTGPSVHHGLLHLSVLKITLDASQKREDFDDDIRLINFLADILDEIKGAPKLEDLTLEAVGFHRDAYATLGRRLSATVFQSLDQFTSRSLPHGDLVGFLLLQPKLTSMTIGGPACIGACPLRLLAHRNRLVSIASHRAAPCASSIVPGNPIEDVWMTDDVWSNGNEFLTMFPLLRQTSVVITHLTLSFPATQLDILPLVAMAAPQVEILDLYEARGSTDRRHRARRPWNDSKKWASQLSQLQNLRMFELSTRSFVLPKTFLPDLWFPRPRLLGRCPMHVTVEYHNDQGEAEQYDWALSEWNMEYHLE